MKKQIKDIPYLEILKKSWKITWSHKYLWWLGLFISLGSLGTSFNYSSGDNEIITEAGQKFIQFINTHYAIFLTLVLLVSLLFIGLALLSLLARGGLIRSVKNILEGKNVSLKESWKFGRENFLKIFSITLVIGLFMFLALLILIVPIALLFFNHSYWIGGILTFLAILIVIPLFILAFFIRTFGYLYAILGRLSIWSSIENAYFIFSKNIGPSFIMGLIFLPVNILVGLGLLIMLIPLAIVFIILGGLLYLVLQKTGIIIAASIGVLVFLIIILIVKSAYAVFNQTAWLLFFQEIASPKKEEPIIEKVLEIEPKPIPEPEVG
ncbi:MAG: hypothetical protein COU40_03305 [Candidatus Moranbacteria bacterium CG10_big_fil_rev_8_21_14_0_10_35_21]|nr:MAG: hypothetical protein COU40_03305 [Candidatus Moranbacteria bacterium CG10_big_fil_rev_8_21_14_0_10_35_21]PJA88646.1 MAG: hypothetical protein CO139_02020 [Candidatus Moranbacteria bacterium CG_4_9_14_3_um_filter_36_9]